MKDLAAYHRQADLRKRRIISGMFGKLQVKITQNYMYLTHQDLVTKTKYKTKSKYEITDHSQDTLVLRIYEKSDEDWDLDCFEVIQFDKTRYHQYCSIYNSQWNITEWFRKI